VKYLFKYIYKGHDRAFVVVRENGKKDANGNVDEITDYKEARWVGPPEAMWRIYGFDLHQCHPTDACAAMSSPRPAYGFISCTGQG
jgi:hypothetical protein